MSNVEKLIPIKGRTVSDIKEEISGATFGLKIELNTVKSNLEQQKERTGVLVDAQRIFGLKSFIEESYQDIDRLTHKRHPLNKKPHMPIINMEIYRSEPEKQVGLLQKVKTIFTFLKK